MTSAPAFRRLTAFAFDPSLTAVIETAALNEVVIHVPWETLEPGPVGEYIEVVDVDPASGVAYHPVDLDHPFVLAQDGVPPSESDPQFHQQMVYAVAMTTIQHFERALGRPALWSDRLVRDGASYAEQFVRRLRIYPHALRDRNAYYSPDKKALLFGYFPVTSRDAGSAPGTVVFTCLSHDVIAHEVTHALLDGVHPRFNEPSNPHVHGFHEAFADIVALFQHFTYPDILESQIARTRGNLHSESLLSQLAQQFGRATGRGAALRDALGSADPETGEWRPRTPDPYALDRADSPHDRGAVLVAAVFRAFLLIYRSRSADLFRIASSGTGVLPEGDLHPDLTRRLAVEAAKAADRVLQMCVRAVDYCPPVDVTFGDFLRAVVTADLEYAPADAAGYRTVFVQSFRDWGIHPRGVTALGPEALVWPSGTSNDDQRKALKDHLIEHTSQLALEDDRFEAWKLSNELKKKLWHWLRDGDSVARAYADLFGLVINDDEAPPTVYRTHYKDEPYPAVEVHSVRPSIRRTVHGGTRTDLVVEVTQRRRAFFDPDEQARMDRPGQRHGREVTGDFTFRAGCTALIDPATQEVRRVIRTAGTIVDPYALERVRAYRSGELGVSGNAFDAGISSGLRANGHPGRDETFALLHQESD